MKSDGRTTEHRYETLKAKTNSDSTVLRSKLTSILRRNANSIQSTQQALADVERLPFAELTLDHYRHCSLCRAVLGTEEELLVLIAQAIDRSTCRPYATTHSVARPITSLCPRTITTTRTRTPRSTHSRRLRIPLCGEDEEDDEDDEQTEGPTRTRMRMRRESHP